MGNLGGANDECYPIDYAARHNGDEQQLHDVSSYFAIMNHNPSSYIVVPGAGVEPARPFEHRFLRPVWLPLHHPGIYCQIHLSSTARAINNITQKTLIIANELKQNV